MDKNYLNQMAKTVDCSYEAGIMIEIDSFMKTREDVSEYSLDYKDGRYILVIQLKNYNLLEVKKIFGSLSRYIEYSSTFYVREDFDDCIEYTLLSSMCSKRGFLCQIRFYP